jgi:hypothetical protein
MFWKSKKKKSPKSRSAPDQTDRYKKPAFNDEQTQTLEILLGGVKLSVDEEREHGGDPHDNSGRYSVEHMRFKDE